MTEHLFLQDNEIHMLGGFNDINYSLLNTLFQVAKTSPEPTIDLHISSPGGLISELEKITLLIQSCEKPVHAYIHNTEYYGVYSGVASAGSVLVSLCQQVFIDPDATFMIHHSRIIDPETFQLKILENEEDIFYWMEKTNQTYDLINYLVKNEVVMDADTAKNLGFVNSIIKNYKYVIPIGRQVAKKRDVLSYI